LGGSSKFNDNSKDEGSIGKGGSECSHVTGGSEYDRGIGDGRCGLGYGGSNEESGYEWDLGNGDGGRGLG